MGIVQVLPVLPETDKNKGNTVQTIAEVIEDMLERMQHIPSITIAINREAIPDGECNGWAVFRPGDTITITIKYKETK